MHVITLSHVTCVIYSWDESFGGFMHMRRLEENICIACIHLFQLLMSLNSFKVTNGNEHLPGSLRQFSMD